MAYLLTHFWPGATEANYLAEVAALHPPNNGLPAGQIYHAAGPTEGGFLIVAVWDSRESEQTFINEILLPGQPVEGGFPNPVVAREADIVNLLSA